MKKSIISLCVFMFVFVLLISGIFFLGPMLTRTKDIVLPDLVGKTAIEAKNLISLYDVNVTYMEVSDDNDGYVVSMNPSALTIVKEKSDLIIYIGINKAFMPDFENTYYSSQAEKIESLQSKYLCELVIIEEVDNNLPIGYIKKQVPSPNTLIIKEMPIIIYTVIHDNLVLVPNMIGWSYDLVLDFQKENDLVFEYAYEYSLDMPSNLVIKQSVAPNTSIQKNRKNAILITISKGIEDIPDFSGMNIEVALFICDYLNIVADVYYVKSNEKINTVIQTEKAIDISRSIILYVSG